MSWLDDFYYGEALARSGIVGSAPTRPVAPAFGDYNPWKLTTGSTPFGVTGGSRYTPPKPQTQKPGFPVRVNLPSPYSRPQINRPTASGPVSPTNAPRASTEGDVFASIGAAFGAQAEALNLANVIPYFMERTNVLSSQLSRDLSREAERGNVAAGAGAAVFGAAGAATGAFLEGVQKVSDVVAPVIDGAINLYRDARNLSNAKVYKAILTGQELSPLDYITLTGDFWNAEQSAINRYTYWRQYEQAFRNAVDPNGTLDPNVGRLMILDSIDIPPSVKAALERNPSISDEALDKLFDEAPEGRQWTYQPGVGALNNLAYPLVGYGLAFVASRGTVRAGGIGASNLALRIGVPAATVERAYFTAQRGVTYAQSLQKWALVSGASLTGLTTALDAVARHQGNEAAIRWFSDVTTNTPYSSNPNVQLVTSFTVNPFAAAGALKSGVLRLAHGGDVTLGKALGQRWAKWYTSDDLVADGIANLYGLRGRAEGRFWISKWYPEIGSAADEVVNQAAQVVLRRLPHAEQRALAALDEITRTRSVLETYGEEIMRVIRDEPKALRQAFQQHHWEYHQMPGAFDPEVAALIASDYRGALRRTVDLRRQLDAVVTYNEMLPPQGQALVREWIDTAADANGNIAIRGVNGLQDLIRQFKVMRRFWQGRVPIGTTRDATVVHRSVVEAMLEEASAEFARTVKANPTRARTGADPVIRLDLPDPQGQYASALGTTRKTIEAYESYTTKPTTAHVDLLREFLVERSDLDATTIAAMAPDDVWVAVDDIITTRTEPWIARGTAVAAAEKRVATLTAELAKLRGRARPDLDRITEIEREIVKLNETVAAVSDPPVVFAERVALEQVYDRAAARIAKMDPANLSAADEAYLTRFVRDNPYHAQFARGANGERLADAAGNIAKGADPYEAAVATMRQIREEGISGPWDVNMAQAAARKVNAMNTLRTLDAIDSEWTEIAGRFGDWRALIGRSRSGQVVWQGGRNRLPAGIVRKFATWLEKERGARGRARAAELRNMGDPDIARMMQEGDLAEFLGTLSVRDKRRVLDFDYAAQDEVLQAYNDLRGIGRGEQGASGDALVDALRASDEAYSEAIAKGGYTESPLLVGNLRRSAGRELPERYVRDAESEATFTFYDPSEELEHLGRVGKIADAISDSATYPALRPLVEADEIVRSRLAQVALDRNIELDAILTDPVHAPLVREALRGLGVENAPIPGVTRAWTKLDNAIESGDQSAIAQLLDQQKAAPSAQRSASVRDIDGPAPEAPGILAPEEPISVPLAEAERLGATGAVGRRSSQHRTALHEAGVHMRAEPDPDLLAKIADTPRGALGLNVISVIQHGVLGRRPQTFAGLLDTMRAIESGSASKLGLGPEMQAAAQEVMEQLFRQARHDAKRIGLIPGSINKGLDPAMLADEDLLLARELFSDEGRVVIGDPSDPLNGLQYALGRRPKNATTLDLAAVPGLTEEFLSGTFQPFQERVLFAQARQVWNWAFGKYANSEIAAQSRRLFVERLGRQGVDAKIANGIWDRWKSKLEELRPDEIRKVSRGPGLRPYLDRAGKGDSRVYGGIGNVPNNLLQTFARDYLDELAAAGKTTIEEARALGSLRYDDVFREATSLIRRTLTDRVPLGDLLAQVYGKAVHNQWVTTNYYLFRFALDVRYHAMNYFEAQILGMGRAGFRKGQWDEGLFGQTERYLRNLHAEPVNNTGFAVARSRHARAYQVFVREQPEALRRTLREINAENPELFERAMREIGAYDEELSMTLRLMGDNVDDWLVKMDQWYRKMLRTVDDADAAATIDDALAPHMAQDPAMAQVYGRIRDANVELWSNVRATFFGNPNRSRAERLLNHYLLYWPISYQIKSAKWLVRTMFDSAGGLPTNAGGAYVVDKMAQSHQVLLETNADYRDWFEKHRTLVFMAEMFLPITPDSLGVSLNPGVRSLLGEHRAIWDVGPIYTLKLAGRAADELYPDFYRTFGDVPAINGIYRAITGRGEPEAPIDALAR